MVIITEMRTTVETLAVTGYGVNARDVLYDVSLYTKKCVSSRRAAQRRIQLCLTNYESHLLRQNPVRKS